MKRIEPESVTIEQIARALELSVKEGKLIKRGDRYYAPEFAPSERPH